MQHFNARARKEMAETKNLAIESEMAKFLVLHKAAGEQ